MITYHFSAIRKSNADDGCLPHYDGTVEAYNAEHAREMVVKEVELSISQTPALFVLVKSPAESVAWYRVWAMIWMRAHGPAWLEFANLPPGQETIQETNP
jgi:hypothetical protein